MVIVASVMCACLFETLKRNILENQFEGPVAKVKNMRWAWAINPLSVKTRLNIRFYISTNGILMMIINNQQRNGILKIKDYLNLAPSKENPGAKDSKTFFHSPSGSSTHVNSWY